MKKLDKHYDAIVIGGGATGAGVARDCALRGLKVLLVERYDLTTGATGRNHGLLHSGARYAVTDRESATECIKENMILRRIASHCVEETGGLFITLPDDDLAYQKTFIDSCRAAGISAEAIDPSEARRLEPSVNPDLIGAVKVPDGAIDPFRLTMANVLDARIHGADVLTYHEVTGFIRTATRIEGVEMTDHRTGENVSATADVVVNAAGIWGHLIAAKAGVEVKMFPAKGALLIFGHRVNNIVINRCRKPANADILVPGDSVCVIGTTSDRVPFEEIDSMEVTPAEVDVLLREGMRLAPSLATTRILRAYAGVRPLVASDDDPSGRSISRGIVCLDHSSRDGLDGFITITGGKLMTYRLMAEWATDMVCEKLGRKGLRCVTAEQALPGSEATTVKSSGLKGAASKGAYGRHGSKAAEIDLSTPDSRALVCECEEVSVGEVEYAIRELNVHNLLNLRRRTRLGMGTCQGQLCIYRAADLLEKNAPCAERHLEDIRSFVNERWKGIMPVAWNDAAAEAEFTAWIFGATAGLDGIDMDEDNQHSEQQSYEI